MNTTSTPEKTTEQATYSIGVVARMTGISAHKIRMWERRYQLGPSKRSKGGQREFTLTEVDHLRLLKQLTDQGMRIGDIARLPMKTLSSLQLQTNTVAADIDNSTYYTTEVVGATLCDYIRSHPKRFPRLHFTFSQSSAEEYLLSNGVPEKTDLLLIQLDTLTEVHQEALINLCADNRHIIIFYHYANKDIREALAPYPIILSAGGVDESQINATIDKLLSIKGHMNYVEQTTEQLNVSRPLAYPRQFDDDALLAAQQLSNKLHCECPTHLVDLIRRLSAFEDYSKNCETTNWQEATIHSCIFSYTNQARYLIEKALTAVLEERTGDEDNEPV